MDYYDGLNPLYLNKLFRSQFKILFPILTFVSQRQSLVEKKPSPLVFPLGSADFIPPLSIIQYNLYLIPALIDLKIIF